MGKLGSGSRERRLETLTGPRGLADRVGFELAVRLAKFGFGISTEFPAALAQFAFREILPREVLRTRSQLSRCGPDTRRAALKSMMIV